MISRLKNKVSFFVAVFLITVMLIFQCKVFRDRDKENPYPISWDVYGYYLYLPATFIYHDLGLQNDEWIKKTREKYKPSSTFYQVTSGKDNKKVIIYNIGYSFVYGPGFLIAHCLAPSLGFEADGFSKPYQLSLLITALLFSFVGIFMFRKIALRFFSDKITASLILIVLLGTNYFFQAASDGMMPHNILFTLNCFIIWFTIKWHEENKIKFIVLLGLFLGLATICRPIELIWILIPLLWNVYNKESFQEKATLLLKHYIQILCFSFLLLCIICIQLFYFKYTTGYYRVLNLHSERFSFFDPYTLKFLFSFKKGWLIYTPIMIFGIIGFYQLQKKNRKILLPLFLFFVINLYVVSSWECWWYANSFSQRPMVETYPMMLFPMGYFLVWINENKKKWIIFSFSFFFFLLIVFNLFQTWQFLKGIIDGERMTKKQYWAVFGKTSMDENSKHYLSVDRTQNVFSDYENYQEKYLKNEVSHFDFESPNKNSIDTMAVDGKKSFLLDSATQFSPLYKQKYSKITQKSYVWIRASVWVYLMEPADKSTSALVVSAESKGGCYKYVSSNCKNYSIKPFVWTEIQLDFLTPDIRHTDDVIKAYFWNSDNTPVLIDNFSVSVFEPKVDYE